MSRRERDKGRKGEAEVAAIYREAGFTVRGLEGAGDHLCSSPGGGRLLVHSETKRQETARPWLWFEQARREAPAGTIPTVAFRRSRSPWLALVELDVLVALVAAAGASVGSGTWLRELDRLLAK